MALSLETIGAPIGRAAAAIETAFVKASESLGRGLTSLETLSAAVGTLGQELSAGSVGSATASIDGLCQHLVRIRAQLPEDVGLLETLVSENERVTGLLDRLLDHIRMVTIISRLARIEAIAFDDDALGLSSFTADMTGMAGRIQGEVEACAGAHAVMSGLIRSALTSQSALDREFEETLAPLGLDLRETLDVIRDRQAASAGLLADVTTRSARIVEATGMALVSLQSGDGLRQRLEHVRDGVSRMWALKTGTSDDTSPISDPARSTAVALLCRLQQAQIADAVPIFEDEAGRIGAALGFLMDETNRLVVAGEATFGHGGSRSESFLPSFHRRLTAATAVVNTCETARSRVAGIMTDLEAMLSDIQTRVSTLNDVTSTIVMASINASLTAMRLGPAGRSLVVIAEELKRLANEIARNTEDLLAGFGRLRHQSSRFGHGSVPDGAAAVGIPTGILGVIADLDRGGQHLDTCLGVLRTHGGLFDAALQQAAAAFAEAVAVNRDLLDAADLLRDGAEAAASFDPDGWAHADALMGPLYTMAREREIHAAVLARGPVGQGGSITCLIAAQPSVVRPEALDCVAA